MAMTARRPTGGSQRPTSPETDGGAALIALIDALGPSDEAARGAGARIIAAWPGICAVTIEVYPERSGRDSIAVRSAGAARDDEDHPGLEIDLLDHDRGIGRLTVRLDDSDFVPAEAPA